MSDALRAPFPYWGGKSRVAPEVWAALGDVDSYVEPFAGSLAVLLGRPDWHSGATETVNDLDQWIANFWRALSADPDAVAHYADWPVNECVPAGTLIATPHGDMAIEHIRPGMTVWGERNGQVVPTSVLATKQSMASEFVSVGGLRMTGNHPVWTKERGYIESEQLTGGLHVAIMDCPINESDLSMLYLGHESTALGNLHTERSENRLHTLCGCDLSRSSTLQRASITGHTGRQNLSGLLDSLFGQRGSSACVSGNRTWARRRLARQGKILDCSLSNKLQVDQFDGRRGRDSWPATIGEVSASGLTGTQGHSIPTRPHTRHVGQESHPRGKGKDSRNVNGAQTLRRSKSQAIACQEGQEARRNNNSRVSGSAHGQELDRGTQAKDRRHYSESQGGFGCGDRSNLRLDYRRLTNVDGERSINQSGDPQGLSLQRESSSIPLTVYNFQTTTHNYFANRILVHNCDLFARHLWLVNEGKRQMIAGMEADPEWFDARIAGWWVYGICAWIGSGWCSGTGPHTYESIGADKADLEPGTGVRSQRPHLGDAGRGVNRQLPHLGDAGQGVNRQLPHLGNGNSSNARNREGGEPIHAYMRALAARLRRVRVCCGDWSRVVTNGALNYGDAVGIFLDPPYSDAAGRTSNLYTVDDLDIAHAVREWAIANGDNPRYRIVLAGYSDEHAAQMPAGWRMHAYRANKAYGTANGGGLNDANRRKERLWFSRFCIDLQPDLFTLLDMES